MVFTLPVEMVGIGILLERCDNMLIQGTTDAFSPPAANLEIYNYHARAKFVGCVSHQ